MTSPRWALLFSAAVVLSLAARDWFPAPFHWIAVVWVVTFAVVGWAGRPSLVRVAGVNLAVAFATLGALEIWATRPSVVVEYNPKPFARRNHVVGYAPVPGSVTRVQKRHAGALVFDAKYTIDEHGLRVAPRAHSDSTDACVVFFGDSFTFGEGLDDHNTLPYRVGMLGRGRFTVHNFAFVGYGPHQMLSALERGRVARAVSCRPTHFVYSAIDDHAARVAGLSPWSKHDPRYRLAPDGTVRHEGDFTTVRKTQPSTVRAVADAVLSPSALYSWVTRRRPRIGDDELRLAVGVVAQAQRIVASRYPDSTFDILFWGAHETSPMMRALQSAGLAPRSVPKALPECDGGCAYHIPNDGHPTALANELLAQYVVDSIIGASRSKGR